MDYQHLASQVHKIAVMLDNKGPSEHRFTRKIGDYNQMNAKPQVTLLRIYFSVLVVPVFLLIY